MSYAPAPSDAAGPSSSPAPTPDAAGRYDERDAAAILRRAADRHAARTTGSAAPRLSLDDLIAAGAAAGLSAGEVRAAALEHATGGDDRAGTLRHVHIVPRLPDEAWGDLTDAMRRAYPGSGTGELAARDETFGRIRRWTWDPGGMLYARLSAAPAPDESGQGQAVALTLEKNVAAHVAGLEWGLPIVSGLLALPLGMLLDVTGAAETTGVLLLALCAALALVGLVATPPVRRRIVARQRRRFDTLAATMSALADAASEAAPAPVATALPRLALPETDEADATASLPEVRVRA